MSTKTNRLKEVIKTIDKQARTIEIEGSCDTLDYDYYANEILRALGVYITTVTTEVVVPAEDPDR